MRTLALGALSLLLSLAASGATLEETIDRSFDVRPGAQLTLSNVNGAVTIHSSDQPRIRVQAKKHVEGFGADAAATAMKELQVEFSQTGGGLKVVTKTPHDGANGFFDFLFGGLGSRSVTYDITVPRAANIQVENVNGHIEAADVTGVLKLETTNGKIIVTRCAGTLTAESTNGSIRAELLRVTPGTPMTFETTNGRITLALPAGYGAMLDAENTNGSIHTDFPVTTNHAGHHSLQGAINGGGPTLHLRTTNGSIDIQSAK